jgi:hypothetical protein
MFYCAWSQLPSRYPYVSRQPSFRENRSYGADARGGDKSRGEACALIRTGSTPRGAIELPSPPETPEVGQHVHCLDQLILFTRTVRASRGGRPAVAADRTILAPHRASHRWRRYGANIFQISIYRDHIRDWRAARVGPGNKILRFAKNLESTVVKGG